MGTGKVVLVSTLILTMFGLSIYFLAPALSPLSTTSRVSSSGVIKAVGVGVYSDLACTTKLSSIDWGTLEPGVSKNVTCYIKNGGNSAITLSLSTANWSPSNASQNITLKWDSGGKSISPSQVVKATLTLSVSSSISGITNFSFDIIIVGTG